jgi:DNA-binding PadR family transcriptional regulator
MKHRKIIDNMVEKEFISRINEPWGSKTIIKYQVSEKGREILKEILEPYEMLFPRSETIDDDR